MPVTEITGDIKKWRHSLGKVVPFMKADMDRLTINLLTAAEACFEMDPTPKQEKNWCNIWSNMEPKKGLSATVVQQQKQTKTTQNEAKQKQRKMA